MGKSKDSVSFPIKIYPFLYLFFLYSCYCVFVFLDFDSWKRSSKYFARKVGRLIFISSLFLFRVRLCENYVGR